MRSWVDQEGPIQLRIQTVGPRAPCISHWWGGAATSARLLFQKLVKRCQTAQSCTLVHACCMLDPNCACRVGPRLQKTPMSFRDAAPGHCRTSPIRPVGFLQTPWQGVFDCHRDAGPVCVSGLPCPFMLCELTIEQ